MWDEDSQVEEGDQLVRLAERGGFHEHLPKEDEMQIALHNEDGVPDN
jgi:hypothetical protein